MASPNEAGQPHQSVKTWLKTLLAKDKDGVAQPEAASQPDTSSSLTGPVEATSSGADAKDASPAEADVDRRRLSVPPDLISFHHSITESHSEPQLSLPLRTSIDGSRPIEIRAINFKHRFESTRKDDPSISVSPPSPTTPAVDWPLSPSHIGRRGSVSKSLGHGVASLHERLQHPRRASETFKRMRAGSDAGSEKSQGSSTADNKCAAGRCEVALGSALDGENSAPAEVCAASTSSVAPLRAAPPSPRRKADLPLATIDDRLAEAQAGASRLSISSGPETAYAPNTACLLLPEGEQMLKVTHKKVKKVVFRLDPDRGQITWQSKKDNKVNLETMREVRFASSAASYRTSLNISAVHEPRWLTIIYQSSGVYKALHLIALSDASLERWRSSLLHLQNLRKDILQGVGAAGSLDARRQMWLKHHWKDADETRDEKLSFAEVQKLCRRLGIEKSRQNLKACFEESDWRNRGFLDFEDFQTFVRLLKRRVDIEDIFTRLADVQLQPPASASGRADSVPTGDTETSAPKRLAAVLPESIRGRGLSFMAFCRFLNEEQKCSDSDKGTAEELFDRYCVEPDLGLEDQPSGRAMAYEAFLDFLTSSDNPPLLDQGPAMSTGPDKPVRQERPSAAETFISSEACPCPTQAATEGDQPARPPLRPSNSTSSLKAPSRANAETAEELLAAGGSNVDSRKLTTSLRKSAVTHDMTRPLSEYYISSSHNTYLVGGQWKGSSTVEGYIRALLQGARSVELDCWDGPNMTPQITHGRTLTTKVPFADVIAAIARYAFVTSPYPLILSLEVHTDVAQQDVMAKILHDTLGDSLLSRRLNDSETADGLPCPEALKYKVLVKAKNLYLARGLPDAVQAAATSTASDSAVTVEAQTASATDTTESENDAFISSARDLVRRVTRRQPRKPDGAVEGATNKGKPGKVLMSAALAALLVYTIGVKCRGFNKKEVYATEHMVSLSEKTALKFIRDPTTRDSLVKHNRNHLTRIYPSMSSFARLHASRNFSPLDMWAAGCQLVALNWQTIDLGFELNQAMFARNGRCGYVLKPSALRIKEEMKTSGQRLRFCVDIEIISAQQLPRKAKDAAKESNSDDRDPIDPFVSVALIAPESWGKQPSSFVRRASTEGSIAGAAFADTNLTKVTSREAKKISSRSSSLPTDAPLVPVASPLPMSPPASGTGDFFQEGNLPPGGSTNSEDVPARIMLKSPTSASVPLPEAKSTGPAPSESSSSSAAAAVLMPKPSSTLLRTPTVRGNGFNPRWNTKMSVQVEVPAVLGFDAAAAFGSRNERRDGVSNEDLPSTNAGAGSVQALSRGMLDLCFLRFEVYDEDLGGSDTSSSSSSASSIDGDCIAGYAVSIGSLQQGYRHLPLYGAELSQFLFSTLFVHTRIRVVGVVGAEKPSAGNASAAK